MAIKLAVKKHIFVTAGIALVILASPFIWYWYQAEQFVSGLCKNNLILSKKSKDSLYTFEVVERDCGASARFIKIAKIQKNTWPLKKTRAILVQDGYKDLSGLWTSLRALEIYTSSFKTNKELLLDWEGVEIRILKRSNSNALN